jgi:hypothetical protein
LGYLYIVMRAWAGDLAVAPSKMWLTTEQKEERASRGRWDIRAETVGSWQSGRHGREQPEGEAEGKRESCGG